MANRCMNCSFFGIGSNKRASSLSSGGYLLRIGGKALQTSWTIEAQQTFQRIAKREVLLERLNLRVVEEELGDHLLVVVVAAAGVVEVIVKEHDGLRLGEVWLLKDHLTLGLEEVSIVEDMVGWGERSADGLGESEIQEVAKRGRISVDDEVWAGLVKL
jgi:hypothetical protein